MTAHPPMPHQLAEAPELAILELLDTALGVTLNALLAIHPQVASADFASEPPGPTALACLADAILTQADALQTMLARYRDCAVHQEEFSEIQRRFARAAASEPDGDIPF